MTIPEQLTKIYYEYEFWHTVKMSYSDAMQYHKTRYENGDIQVYIENGQVLGYYERYLLWNACILYNLWIKQGFRKGKVIKELKKRFFETLPKNINVILGEKQKLGGKMMVARIRRK